MEKLFIESLVQKWDLMLNLESLKGNSEDSITRGSDVHCIAFCIE